MSIFVKISVSSTSGYSSMVNLDLDSGATWGHQQRVASQVCDLKKSTQMLHDLLKNLHVFGVAPQVPIIANPSQVRLPEKASNDLHICG